MRRRHPRTMTSVTLSLIVEDKKLQEVWKQEIRRERFLSGITH